MARVDALARAARDHTAHRGEVADAERDRELADDWLRVKDADVVDRGQALTRVSGSADEQLTELDEPAASEPGEVDDAGERVQRLRRADVRRSLLAADVLLARLQRQNEPAAAVDVDRLAGDAARHPSHVLVARGEEAERRAAEIEAVSERLALADADVDAELAGRLENAERQRVRAADDERATLARGPDQQLRVLDRAEEVRLREEDGADVLVDRRRPSLEIGDAVATGTSVTDMP